MKICSTSYAIGNCKLKQQWDTTAHLLEWLTSKILTATNADEDVEQQELSFIAGGNALPTTLENFFTKQNIALSYNPAIVFLGIYSNELKTYVHIKASIGMLIAVFFIIAKFWKQPRCPSEGEWINKLWYIHTVDSYSV